MAFALRFMGFTYAAAIADQTLVEQLNTAYQSYDPGDDASPYGVMVTAFESAGEEPYLADCTHCGHLYSSPLPTNCCRVSASILNSKNSHIEKDWKASQLYKLVRRFSMDCGFFRRCDVQVGLYPSGPFNPLKGEFSPLLDQGGAIFGPAVEQAMKCFYPFDGATVLRPNRGCGCTSMVATICPPNKNWSCPTTLNTCSAKDPLSKHDIDADSSVLSACQCTNMGVSENDNPLWRGLLGLQYLPGLPKCTWVGPQYFNGTGRNELRSALKQQYNFRKDALYPWNEIVLDGQVYNGLFQKDASNTVQAFWYPRSRNCRRACKAGVYASRDAFARKYGVHVPVIEIDLWNGTAPFVVVPQDLPKESPEANAVVTLV